MQQKLILVRGVPGSGKSTMAKLLLNAGVVDRHLEADQFRYNEKGEYVYDANTIPNPLQLCYDMTEKLLSERKSVVVCKFSSCAISA